MDAHTDNILSDYRKWLLKMANVLMPWGTEADKQDLAQEGHIAMWRALKSYDPAKGALPSWLTTAARLRMSNVIRRGNYMGKPSRRGKAPEQVPTPLDPQNDTETFESLIEGDEWVEHVMVAYHAGEISKALRMLKPHQRDYVIRRFWRGQSGTVLDLVAGKRHWDFWREEVKPELAKHLRHLAGIV